MKNTQLITFENPKVGTIKGFIDNNGEPWFLSGQACRCLKLDNSSKVISRLKAKHNKFGDKIDGVALRYLMIEDNIGRKQRTAVINEPLLYELIFYSETKKAFEFQQWVLKDVLPSLRKHGIYRMEGKIIRRSLTDTIQSEIINKTESLNTKRFAYSNFSKLINKSLGLPNSVDRNSLDADMLEKIAHRENLVQSLIAEGKQYNEIKTFIESNFKVG